MRIKRATAGIAEADLTPMIDMTFQLIAFFMVLINFTEADMDERVKLPSSELAKPPAGPLETPIFIQLTKDGKTIFNGQFVTAEQLTSYLIREREILALNNKTADQATIILRADAAAATGKVQEVIQLCQREGFEKFSLRAKEEIGY